MLLASQKREIDAISHGDSGHLGQIRRTCSQVYGEGVDVFISKATLVFSMQ